jgi:hypothetical protein
MTLPLPRRIARAAQAQAETPTEYAARKLCEVDRELLYRLYDRGLGKPVRLADLFGRGEAPPDWAEKAVARCIQDGELTADQDGRLTLTPKGLASAKVGQAEAIAFARRENVGGARRSA